MSHTLAWVAGCCPLIAIGVEFMLGSMGVSSGWAVFGGAMAINSVITYADEAYLKKIGFDTKSLSNAWLIPIYLFARPHVAGGGNGPGILWCILFVLSFLPVFSPLAPPLPDGSQIDTSGTITAIASGSADSGLSSANMGPSVKVKIDRGELSGQVFEVSTQAGDPVLQFPVGSRLRVTGTFHMRSGRMTIDPISLWPAT